jgi:hypothetical protein
MPTHGPGSSSKLKASELTEATSVNAQPPDFGLRSRVTAPDCSRRDTPILRLGPLPVPVSPRETEAESEDLRSAARCGSRSRQPRAAWDML